MVLDGLKWFEAKNQKSMTINYKSAISYLILTHIFVNFHHVIDKLQTADLVLFAPENICGR